MTFTSGPLVTQDWSSDRVANLGIASGSQVSLDLPGSCSFSPYDSVHAVGNQAPNDHEGNEEGEDYAAHRQATSKCLMQYAVHQAIILVLGVDSCVEVELKASSYGAQFHQGFSKLSWVSVMCSGVGGQFCERGDRFARL